MEKNLDCPAATAAGNESKTTEPNKLTQEERRAQVCLYLRTRVGRSGDKLENGAFDDACSKFGYAKGGIRRIWDTHKNAILYPDQYELDVSRKSGSGRKRKHSLEEVQAAIKNVPCRYRQTIRSLSKKVGIPSSTLHTYLQEGGLANETIAMKNKEEIAVEREEERKQRQSTLQTNLQQAKNENESQLELKAHYEREKAKAVEDAKAEARREHHKHLEHMKKELREEFQTEKDRVLYELRVEMERHSLELARLKGELDRIGNTTTTRDECGGSSAAKKRKKK